MGTAGHRLALQLLPLLLLLASVAALIVAPFSWGAADHAGLPGWMPPFTALAFGVPALLIGLVSLGQISGKTTNPYRTFWFQLIFGVIAMLVMITVVAVVSARVAVPSTYDSLLGDSQSSRSAGSQAAIPDSNDRVTPAAYMLVTVVMAAGLSGVTAAATYVYVNSIEPASIRLRPIATDEIDSIGEIMRGRGAHRLPPQP